MIAYWVSNEGFDDEKEALDCYGGTDFDCFCKKCDGTTLLSFDYEVNNTDECFEVVDNNFVIPVSAINIYT